MYRQILVKQQTTHRPRSALMGKYRVVEDYYYKFLTKTTPPSRYFIIHSRVTAE